MTHDPTSIHKTDKEERPKQEEPVNELSVAPCAPSLIQKPEKRKLKFIHFEFDEVKISTDGCLGRTYWFPKANTL